MSAVLGKSRSLNVKVPSKTDLCTLDKGSGGAVSFVKSLSVPKVLIVRRYPSDLSLL